MEDDRTKRRRIISPHLAPQLDNLTEILLVKVAEYLPQISRALLAVALTTDSSRWRKVDWNRTPLLSWLKTQKKQPSPETKTVARMNKWDTLDFSVCESSLASKLSDDDIAAVLSCINAVKYMKKLKLTGCIGITGCGLEPLRGSVVLEWIDANVIYWKEERMKPMMCERTVLPILDSVIDTPGNSLKYVNLPESFWTYGSKEDYNRGEQRWNSPCTTKEYTKESNVEAFLERWKRHLVDLEFQCTKDGSHLNSRIIALVFMRKWSIYKIMCAVNVYGASATSMIVMAASLWLLAASTVGTTPAQNVSRLTKNAFFVLIFRARNAGSRVGV